MLWWKKKLKPSVRGRDLTAFIDEGSEIEGKYTFSGTVMLNGRFRGEIVSNDSLIVGEKGVVNASIRAGVVLINGEVEAPVIVIEEGVLFEGHCRMTKARPAAAPVVRDLSVVTLKRYLGSSSWRWRPLTSSIELARRVACFKLHRYGRGDGDGIHADPPVRSHPTLKSGLRPYTRRCQSRAAAGRAIPGIHTLGRGKVAGDVSKPALRPRRCRGGCESERPVPLHRFAGPSRDARPSHEAVLG